MIKINFSKTQNISNQSINYYILQDNVNGRIVYGIAIEKIVGNEIIEEEIANGITYCYEIIEKIAFILSENQVYPCHLINILDDFDFEEILQNQLVI